MHRHEVTDEEGALIHPVAPMQVQGVPRSDHRRMVDGLLWWHKFM